jgi:hypothetical protein
MNRNHIAALAGAAAVIVAASVAVAGGPNEVAGRPTASTADPLGVAANPAPTTTTTREPAPLDLDDFIATLKVTDKQCFGDESGPVITTIDGTGESYNLMPVLLSTRGPGVTPKVKVTDVQEY